MPITVTSKKDLIYNINRIKEIANYFDIALWATEGYADKNIFFSKALRDLYELESQNIDFNLWKTCIHPDDLDDVLIKQKNLSQGKKLIYTYRIITTSGTVKWVKDQTLPFQDNNGYVIALLGTVTDVSETQKLYKTLKKKSFYNEITDMPNRSYGRKKLASWIDEHHMVQEHFAIMTLDLDGFKRINDAFGQEIADEVLKKFAHKVKLLVGQCGLVFHLGGDEFLILINSKEEPDDYNKIAQQLIKKIEIPLLVNQYEFYLTASIGLSVFPKDGRDRLTLVKNANIALNLAKKLGKNNYQSYSSSMHIEMKSLFNLELDLRKAIDNEELFLEYQPRVSAKTKQVNSVEALIRWKHSNLGLVSPAEFIPLAEKTGIINSITDYVIKTVCKQIQQWKEIKIPIQYISINVSPMSFLRNDFIERFTKQLKKHSISGSMIELEITEGILLYPSEVVDNQINDLNAMGTRIALDDYGTGYSSVHYIKRYPFNTIKIDRTFIQNIIKHKADAVIVKSIIDMAKGLMKTVVAEGVETSEQYYLLKNYGCDEIQGYYFSRPISAIDTEKYIKNSHFLN